MALAPYAMDVSHSRGRRYFEPPHPYRNDYARDRDRVIHSRAFRRLEAKTQVFTTRYSDHFRNRLTHTLEVAQIARTVAGALGLQTDLAEALALVHDIGHPPFGHAGEHRLDDLMRRHGDVFDHNLHALRIVEQFEQRYLDFSGLNLTFEVREGIIKHSRDYRPAEFPELAEYLLDQRPPLEAQLIDCVDEIAYNTADLDDGYEARLLDLQTILEGVPVFAETFAQVDRHYPAPGRDRTKLKFNEALKLVLDRLATDLIENHPRPIERRQLLRRVHVPIEPPPFLRLFSRQDEQRILTRNHRSAASQAGPHRGSGAAVNRKSQRLRDAHASLTASRSRLSRMGIPIEAMEMACTGSATPSTPEGSTSIFVTSGRKFCCRKGTFTEPNFGARARSDFNTAFH